MEVRNNSEKSKGGWQKDAKKGRTVEKETKKQDQRKYRCTPRRSEAATSDGTGTFRKGE